MKSIVLSLTLLMGFSSQIFAQSKTGQVLMGDQRWVSAEKEFAKSQEDIDVFYAGYCQIKQEESEKAKTTFNSIAAKPFGKIGLGLLELNSNNVAGADMLFEESASATKNKNPEVFVAISRAIVASNVNAKEKSIEWAKKAVDVQPKNADYRLVYGEAFLSTQDGGSAITQYEYAQQYAPSSALPYAKIGQVYFRNRTYSLMKENLMKALTIDPNNVFANEYMAQLYYKYKSYDSAQIFQQKVIDLGDKSPADMAFMANILFEKKDFEGAINLINEIIKVNQKYNYLNRLIGYSYYETKKPAEAITFLEKFLETQPKERIISSDYDYLGKAYMEVGQADKAVATLKRAIETNPTDKETMINVAKTLKDQKRFDDALEIYSKILQLSDPAPVADDYFQQAQIYFSKKDWANAEAGYTKAIELAPNSSTAYYQRATVKLYADPEQSTASAKPDYAKFIELSVGNEKLKKQIVKANLYMAKDALKNLNDKTAAKTYLDAALALDAANAEALELMKVAE